MSFSKIFKVVWNAVGPEPETLSPQKFDPPDPAVPSPPAPDREAQTTADATEWTAAEAALIPGGIPVASGVLKGRCGLSLQPWDDRYSSVACRWRNDWRFLHLWSGNRKRCTREEVWADICYMLENTIFFLIHQAGKEEPIGCVYAACPASKAQRYLQVNTLLPPENQKLGHGSAATLLFVDYLFEHFDISKIAFEIYGWNAGSIKTTAHLPQVKLEGIRRNHVHLNGKAYDHYEFGLSRAGFQEVKKSAAWRRLIGT